MADALHETFPTSPTPKFRTGVLDHAAVAELAHGCVGRFFRIQRSFPQLPRAQIDMQSHFLLQFAEPTTHRLCCLHDPRDDGGHAPIPFQLLRKLLSSTRREPVIPRPLFLCFAPVALDPTLDQHPLECGI